MNYETYIVPNKWEGEADLKYLKDNVYIGGYEIRSEIETYQWMEQNFDMNILKLSYKIVLATCQVSYKKLALALYSVLLRFSYIIHALKAVRENLARSNPDYAQQLSNINKAFANYAIIREAGSKANTAEKFTPAQLAAAVKKSDQSAGKGATATGKAMMQDLTDAGVLVLPNTLPDSGTAVRMMAANMKDWLLGTAATIPYALGGKAITSRPEGAKEIAKLIRENPSIANSL